MAIASTYEYDTISWRSRAGIAEGKAGAMSPLTMPGKEQDLEPSSSRGKTGIVDVRSGLPEPAGTDGTTRGNASITIGDDGYEYMCLMSRYNYITGHLSPFPER